jgi:hypothetical protein
VIRNVCIHVTNEQPLLCDLFALPSSTDAGLVCTNVRSMDGKRPVFIDQTGSTFLFPYHVVRFLEIPEASMAEYVAAGGRLGPATSRAGEPTGDPLADRYARAANGHADGDDTGDGVGPGSLVPIAVGPPAGAADDDLDIEIDEDFLKRVREI